MKSTGFFRKFSPRRKAAKNRGHGKLETRLNASIKKANDPVFARRFVTVGVIVSTVMVLLSLFVAIYFNPTRVAERKIEEMAREYYEEYYFQKFMETADSEALEEKKDIFMKVGLQPVKLRQLLLYQNGKNSGYRKYFEKEGFSCDKNESEVKFKPVEPFTAKDYTLEVKLACEKE